MKRRLFRRVHILALEFFALMVANLSAQKEISGDANSDPTGAVRQWNSIAIELQERGRFQEAHQAYQRARKLAENGAIPPSSHLRLLLNQVSLQIESGNYSSGEQLIRTAEDLALKAPANSPELAGFYNAVGTIRLIGGNLSEARKAYGKALELLDHPGAQHSDEFATALLNMASVQMRQGLYVDARASLARAISVLGEVAGTHKSRLIRALANQSTLEYLAQDWVAAEKALIRALALAESHYEPDNPIFADLFQNYSSILERLHRGKKARMYRERARALLPNPLQAVSPLIDSSELRSSKVRPAVRSK